MIKSESYYNERIRFSLKKGIQLGKVMGRIQKAEEVEKMIDTLTIDHKVRPRDKKTIIVGENTICDDWHQKIIQPRELKQKLKEAQNE